MPVLSPGLYWSLLPLLLVVQGCYKPRSVIQNAHFRLPMPTKDEVALVNEQPLSISDYLNIRKIMADSTRESAIWAGISALSLQHQAGERGVHLSARTSLDIARYALRNLSTPSAIASLQQYYHFGKTPPSPEWVKKELEELVEKSVVKRSPVALSSFD